MNDSSASMIDCHAHLCDAHFAEDLAAVLTEAEKAGVRHIVSVSETIADVRRNLQLAALHPCIEVAAGLYPEFADLEKAEEMGVLIREHSDQLAAIGEVGLDFWLAKTEAEKELQRQVFSIFIALALEFDLPLNVHSRSAGRHAIAQLIEARATRVQMHAFDGKTSAAAKGIEAGFFFSVPPSVVRSRQKQKLAKYLPLDTLLLETDSPVLGPYPGQRNVPGNLILAARAVAELKKIPVRQVLEAARQNSLKLYGNRLA